MLLSLSAVIAAAGVISDSTATVIGAMIVAPLMSPILGIVLATVLNDRANLMRCLAAVVGGVAIVIAIGFLLGLTTGEPVVASTNSQVSGRVSPTLIDLVAALATGAVGSIALLRSDISDTLPGVAIAISLVPPLSVVGLTLESGAPAQAGGAMLLFLANVSAIMATAVVTMGVYGMFEHAPAQDSDRRAWNRPGVVVIATLAVIVAIPLIASSVQITRSKQQQSAVSTVATAWADEAGWGVESVDPSGGHVRVRVLGPLPAPKPDQLRAQLDEAGLQDVTIDLEMVPEARSTLTPVGG